MSKRRDGGVTRKSAPLHSKSNPSAVKMRTISAGSISIPRTCAARLQRKRTGARCGRCAAATASTSGPALPPQISSIKAVARAMELWADITKRPPITTYKTSLFAMQRVYVDPAKAINELGMPQTPVATALADAVQWYRDNGYV